MLSKPSITKDNVLTVEKLLTKQLVVLVMKTIQKKPEIEYIHYALQIIRFALAVPSLRHIIVSEDLTNGGTLKADQIREQANSDECVTYSVFLRVTVEKMAEIISIKKLH